MPPQQKNIEKAHLEKTQTTFDVAENFSHLPFHV
jgi:hypothetical protein